MNHEDKSTIDVTDIRTVGERIEAMKGKLGLTGDVDNAKAVANAMAINSSKEFEVTPREKVTNLLNHALAIISSQNIDEWHRTYAKIRGAIDYLPKN